MPVLPGLPQRHLRLGLVISAERSAVAWPAYEPALVSRAVNALETFGSSALMRATKLAVRLLRGALSPLSDALQPLQTQALAFRGAESPAESPADVLRYQITLAAQPLELELSTESESLVAVHIRPLRTPPQGLCLRLTAGGQTCALSTLHDDGAHLSILPAGDYELTLERGDERLDGLTLHIDAA